MDDATRRLAMTPHALRIIFNILLFLLERELARSSENWGEAGDVRVRIDVLKHAITAIDEEIGCAIRQPQATISQKIPGN